MKLSRAMTKKVVGTVVGFGCSAIVKSLVKGNVTGTSRIDKVGVLIGAWALGGLAGDAAMRRANNFVDDLFDHYEKHIASEKSYSL